MTTEQAIEYVEEAFEKEAAAKKKKGKSKTKRAGGRGTGMAALHGVGVGGASLLGSIPGVAYSLKRGRNSKLRMAMSLLGAGGAGFGARALMKGKKERFKPGTTAAATLLGPLFGGIPGAIGYRNK